jgi:triacylglycerol lipase
MSARPRTLIVLATAILLIVVAVAGFRWLTRTEPIDGEAVAPGSAVILIPGYGGGADSLASLADHLRAAGRYVVIADIGDGHGDLRGYGAQVARTARGLVADGSASVDLVGYSEGGLIARAAVEADPSAFARVATIASPHAGTSIAGLGAILADQSTCPLACQQMAPDSDFLGSLRPPGDPTRWLSVYSAGDDVIRPPESSDLEGATNAELTATCGTSALDHGGVVRSPATWTLVTGFLSTGQLPSCSST